MGHDRSFGDVGSTSGLPESGRESPAQGRLRSGPRQFARDALRATGCARPGTCVTARSEKCQEPTPQQRPMSEVGSNSVIR